MGEHEELLSGLLLNGLLPTDSSSGIRVLDGERWAEAEKRTAELIACIQPNQPSEDRRGAVADYVQRLIMRCFPCQVVTFGSVPLKTYLPDGDIDVTAFSKNQNLKDTWAVQVRDLLESEEKNENAEFCVKEVQYIQAEVKIIKCLVENIVVDISFNQLGGLCTLCFLEEVDNLINQDHLFKRSIILIKAWCYYESRILGAHHGLISTYALETLVLYIFHIFNNSFTGPLEVLYRFLEFFRNFDWENFCVSLWGPVPVKSLPDINAEPPRKDGGRLLLSKGFLQACNSVYAVFPEGLENQGQPFISKHLNVIDPLRINNNLGRSVSKGNYYRIRSAFAYGAKRLSRVLDCPKENIAAELNRFFMNTWERHDSGIRPDAPVSDLACVRLSDPDHGSDNHSNSSYNKESIDVAPTRVTGIEAVQSTWPLSSQSIGHSREGIPNCNDAPTGFSSLGQKINVKPSSLRMLDQPEQLNPTLSIQSDRSKRTLKHDEISNQLQGKHLFTRTRSSPELTDAYRDSSSRSRRIKPAVKRDVPVDSASVSNSHIDDLGSVTIIEDRASVIRAQELHQQEQDLVNMMASSSLHDFAGHIPMPLNLGSPHLPLPISQTVIGSMGMLPANTPLVDPHWASSVQFQQALMSYHFSQCFRGVGLSTNSEDIVLNGGFGPEEETLEVSRGEDGQPSTSGNSNFVSSSRMASSGSSLKAHRRERPTSVQNDYMEPFPTRDDRVIETYSDERISGGKTSSESSWDGSSTRVSKAAPDKRGRKAVTSDPVSSKIQVKGKSILEQASTEVDDGYRDCITLPTTGNKIDDKITASQRGTDNSGTGRFTFYPTGPPVPFFTMLPVYNYPGEGEGSEPSGTPLGGEGGFCNSNSGPNFESTERHAVDVSEEPKRDILNSDFASHWQNLQFGRLCQGPRYPAPLVYPSPTGLPQMYLQGRVPWDGQGRPLLANPNLVSQLMSHHLVPVIPLQPDSSAPTTAYQRYADELPRYRSGTGTYLPNHKVSARDRHFGTRRNSYNYDRSDHSDREGNWNTAKSRAAGRSYNRRQADKSRVDRLSTNGNWAYRHQPLPYQSQNGPLRPSSSHGSSASVAYGMYPITQNGPNMQSVVMLYPYENHDQPEFGSVGPVGYVGSNDASQLYEDQRYHRSSAQQSSPDQPSSPRFHRRI